MYQTAGQRLFSAWEKPYQASATDFFFFFFFFSVLSPARAIVATGRLGTSMVSGTLDFFLFSSWRS